MNLPINSSQLGLPGTSNSPVGGVGSTGDAAQHNSPGASLADQDWFSAQELSMGNAIEAGSFDSTANRMSVEEAANNVHSNIFPTHNDRDTPWV